MRCINKGCSHVTRFVRAQHWIKYQLCTCCTIKLHPEEPISIKLPKACGGNMPQGRYARRSNVEFKS